MNATLDPRMVVTRRAVGCAVGCGSAEAMTPAPHGLWRVAVTDEVKFEVTVALLDAGRPTPRAARPATRRTPTATGSDRMAHAPTPSLTSVVRADRARPRGAPTARRRHRLARPL